MKTIVFFLSALLAISSMGHAPAKITANETPTLSSPSEIESMVEDCVNTYLNGQFSMDKVAEIIEAFERENRSEQADWSLEVIDLNTGQSAGYQENEMQTAASSIKLFIAGALMEQAQDNLIVEEDDNTVVSPAGVGAQDLDPEVYSMLRSMLTISDNEAATSLIFLLGEGDGQKGKAVVNSYCSRYGFDNTYLGIFFTGIDPEGEYNGTCARDTARFMQMIYDDELPGSGTILDLLNQSERLEKIPFALPAGVQAANKTGELDMTQNDTAIIYAKRPFVLSIMIDNEEFSKGGWLIRDLAGQIFPVFNDTGKEQ